MPEDKQDPAVSLTTRRLAKEVVDRSEFIDIRLDGFSGDHNLNPLTPAEFDVAVTIQANPRVESDSRLLIMMRFTVAAAASQGGSGVLRMVVSYALEYRLTTAAGLSQEHYVAFAEWVSVYNAWPYLREFVHHTTAEMTIGSIRLPLYRPTADGHSAGKVDASWSPPAE